MCAWQTSAWRAHPSFSRLHGSVVHDGSLRSRSALGCSSRSPRWTWPCRPVRAQSPHGCVSFWTLYAEVRASVGSVAQVGFVDLLQARPSAFAGGCARSKTNPGPGQGRREDRFGWLCCVCRLRGDLSGGEARPWRPLRRR